LSCQICIFDRICKKKFALVADVAYIFVLLWIFAGL